MWYAFHFGPDGEERECLVTRILDGPEEAVDIMTGEPVTEYFKAPPSDGEDEDSVLT